MPKCEAYIISIVGIVMLILGIYSVFGLEPLGFGSEDDIPTKVVLMMPL